MFNQPITQASEVERNSVIQALVLSTYIKNLINVRRDVSANDCVLGTQSLEHIV